MAERWLSFFSLDRGHVLYTAGLLWKAPGNFAALSIGWGSGLIVVAAFFLPALSVIHHSWNMSLPHVEFVRRTTGQLPDGAWVGTVSKLDGEIMAITSKHFFNYQLPAPPDVDTAIRKRFE